MEGRLCTSARRVALRFLVVAVIAVSLCTCVSCQFLDELEILLSKITEEDIERFVQIVVDVIDESQNHPPATPQAPTSERPVPRRTADSAPFPSFIYSPELPEVDLEIKFDGSVSSDQEGPITGYSWQFDDGTTRNGPLVFKSFAEQGPQNVTLTVYDQSGARASCSRPMNIASNIHIMPDLVGPGLAMDLMGGTAILFRQVYFCAETPADDFIALIATSQCSLRGYSVRSSTGHTYTFQRDVVLNANSIAILKSGFGRDAGLSFYWGSSIDLWDNYRGSASLFNPSGQLLDVWFYDRQSSQ